MNKLCIVILVLGLMVGGNSCGRSKEKSKVRPSIEKSEVELNEMERSLIGEGGTLEEEVETQEEEMEEEAEASDKKWDYDEESENF